MGKVVVDISMSLDGFVAGPNPTLEEPLGEKGEELHEWVVRTNYWRERHGLEGGEEDEDSEVIREAFSSVGASVMGRKMFSGGSGPWESDPRSMGWWGDEPPFHTPVFVLTHHAREPEEMQGGTTFHFVTDGIESALEQARAAAGVASRAWRIRKEVSLGGGASVAQQYLAAGLLDEIVVSVVPILLGGGARLFENVGDAKLEQVESVDAPGVTHIRYARS